MRVLSICFIFFFFSGSGAVHLAEAVKLASNVQSSFRYLYSLDLTLKEKIKHIACQVYGAEDILHCQMKLR